MKAGAWSTHRVFPINLNGLSVNAPLQASTIRRNSSHVCDRLHGGGGRGPKGAIGGRLSGPRLLDHAIQAGRGVLLLGQRPPFTLSLPVVRLFAYDSQLNLTEH